MFQKRINSRLSCALVLGLLLSIAFSGLQSSTVSAALVITPSDTVYLHVKEGVPVDPDNYGLSWDTALPTLQDALDVAEYALDNYTTVKRVEIWVASGIYFPTSDYGMKLTVDGIQTTSPRLRHFRLQNKVAVYGGFPSNGGSWDTRNPSLYQTILTGDIGSPGVITDNCYHVFYHPQGLNLSSSAVLDGFTISDGYAGPYSNSLSAQDRNNHMRGAGMHNYGNSPTLRNITFSSNQSYSDGGGIYNGYSSSPTLSNVSFIGNSTSWNGGGMSNEYDSNPKLDKVVFTNNTANVNGGGIFNFDCSPVLTNAKFLGNRAVNGGGMNNNTSEVILINGLFDNNYTIASISDSKGGGIYNFRCNPFFVNVSFSGNRATLTGGGVYNNGSSPIFDSCILWGNTAPNGPEVYNATYESYSASYNSTPVFYYSIINGSRASGSWDSKFGNDEIGNLDIDPMFVQSPGLNSFGDLRLKDGSPAINSGDNSSYETGGIAVDVTVDLDGNPRVYDGRVDIGAYENQTVQTAPGPGPGDPASPGQHHNAERFGGSNRFETAVAISQSGWEQSDVVILARANNYADALAGVSLAYKENAPVLLTDTRTLHTATRTEILRLQAQKVFVLGGTNAVSEDVVAELEELGLTVQRISGSNRYDTAVAIAKYVAPEGANQAVLAYGLNFPDALSVASYAAANSMPILLTAKNQIPAETQQAIIDMGIDHLIVVGGSGVISEASLSELASYERVSGTDRYSTSIALAEHFTISADRVFVATGLGYADAITGAALAAREGCGLILVGRNVPESVSDFLNGMTVNMFTVLGGTGVISESVVDQLTEN